VPPIAILLLDIPVLLGEILREAVGSDPDFVVLGEATLADLGRIGTSASAVDIVVCAGMQPDGSEPQRLLRGLPHAKLVVLHGAADRASVWELIAHESVMHELSPAGLLDALRSSTRVEAD